MDLTVADAVRALGAGHGAAFARAHAAMRHRDGQGRALHEYLEYVRDEPDIWLSLLPGKSTSIVHMRAAVTALAKSGIPATYGPLMREVQDALKATVTKKAIDELVRSRNVTASLTDADASDDPDDPDDPDDLDDPDEAERHLRPDGPGPEAERHLRPNGPDPEAERHRRQFKNACLSVCESTYQSASLAVLRACWDEGDDETAEQIVDILHMVCDRAPASRLVDALAAGRMDAQG